MLHMLPQRIVTLIRFVAAPDGAVIHPPREDNIGNSVDRECFRVSAVLVTFPSLVFVEREITGATYPWPGIVRRHEFETVGGREV